MNHPDDATPDRQPSLLRTVVAAVLALALVASLAWLVIEVIDRADSENADQKDRDAAMLATREYMTAAWNFGPGDLDDAGKLTGFVDRVTPLITTKFKADFDKTVELLAKQVAEQDYTVSAGVDRVGVESLGPDSAQVIVGGEISTRQDKQASRTEGYLWRVDLKRVDDSWRVDNFNAYETVAAR